MTCRTCKGTGIHDQEPCRDCCKLFHPSEKNPGVDYFVGTEHVNAHGEHFIVMGFKGRCFIARPK